MNPKRLWLLVLVVSSSLVSFSQNNISGTWEGKFYSPFLALGQPKLVVEIYDVKDSVFTGVSHLYYEGNKYEHYKIIGWYSPKDSVLIFREASTIAVDLGEYGNCLGTYMVILGREPDKWVQYGLWRSNIPGCSPDTKVWLQKNIEEIKKEPPLVKTRPIIKKPAQATDPGKGKMILPVIATTPSVTVTPTKLPEKNIQPVKIIPSIIPEKVARRETDVQSLLEISTGEKDSIKVEVYDNGEIDGDSVSVYEDRVQRINKKRIGIQPLTFYVSLDKKVNPISHLRLVAESLGSIPPCTALMIVTTRTKRYEVHLSSNFNKNATMELFLKE